MEEEGGGGGGGGIQTKKSFFGPLGLSLRKNTGGAGWAPRAPPLDPPLINTYGL